VLAEFGKHVYKTSFVTNLDMARKTAIKSF